MIPCVSCGDDVAYERTLLGYVHCTRRRCVDIWRSARLNDNFRLDLVPKVGFAISLKDDPAAASMGRSSGRTV